MTTAQLPIVNTLSAAWDRVSGAKSSIWAAIGLIVLIHIGISILVGIIKVFHFFTLAMTVGIVGQIFIALLQTSILYLGIQRAHDFPISYNLLFRIKEPNIAARLIVCYLLQALIILMPFAVMVGASYLVDKLHTVDSVLRVIFLSVIYALGIVVVIYLGIRMRFSAAFILDKNIHAWEAIKRSFAITEGNVWRLIGLYLIMGIVLIVSLIPFGIGLIWTIPLFIILYGTIYKRLAANIGYLN